MRKTVNYQDIHFEKLKYYFWTYVDPTSRVKLLVRVKGFDKKVLKGTLPEQSMEQLALDVVRENGELWELWKSVMRYVPEDLQQHNPYSSVDYQQQLKELKHGR